LKRGTIRLVAWITVLGAALGVLQTERAAPHSADPAAVFVGWIRLAGLAMSWYLLAVTLLTVAASLSRVRVIRRLADAVALPVLRRFLTAMMATTVAFTASATAVHAAGPAPGSPAAAAPAPLSMRRLIDPPLPQRPDSPATWMVQRGDHFWHIAQAVLTDSWQRQPTVAEIDRYWRRLIAANRNALRDPGNPDLIFVGQVFALPPPG
jgi:hypothetical protein